jgi:Tfp pilus assembly protein PilP
MSTVMKLPRALATSAILLALAAACARGAEQRKTAPPVKSVAAPARPAPRPVPAAAQPKPAPVQPEPAQPAGATFPGQTGSSPQPQMPTKPVDASAPFTYNADGRRDPFISLIGKGSDPKNPGTRPPGVPGLLIGEVSVKGIVRNSSGYVALIQGADNKTYVVKAGDHLLDGTVKSVVPDAVVFSQDVSDPLSLVKQKEVRKPLRSAEGGRG